MKLKIKTPADLESDAQDREVEEKRAEALAYLAKTDWYVTRAMETGRAVPVGVTEKREAARRSL